MKKYHLHIMEQFRLTIQELRGANRVIKGSAIINVAFRPAL